jgi:excisionase family DNA binding protein
MAEDKRETLEPLLTVTEAALALSVSKRTIEKWVLERRIPFVKLGGAGRGTSLRFRPEALREWIEAQEIAPKESK